MDREQLYNSAIRHFLTPVLAAIDDENVTEIMVNGHSNVYLERHGRIEKTPYRFTNESQLLAAVRNIAEYVGRELDNNHLTMDGRLADGSRVHVAMPPVSRVGICLTIRKFRSKVFSLDELQANGSIESSAAEILKTAIRDHLNIVVAGGTGTGKTSLLNALSLEIAPTERIVVIEESSELKLNQPHTLYLEAIPHTTRDHAEVSIRELFVNALRMRPDRILIGEVRRGEALEMIQAMLSGHAGSLSTLHANSPETAATRLETLCLLNDAQLPVYVARAQVAAAIDLFVQAQRLSNGQRCITRISRLTGLDERQNYVWQELYRRQEKTLQKHVQLGIPRESLDVNGSD